MAAGPAFYKTLWGVTQPLAELLPQLAASPDYAGVEACLPYTSPADKATILAACRAGTIKVILMLQTSGDTVADHLASLDAQLAEAAEFSPHIDKVNIHGGCDFWTFQQSCEYFTGFLALEAKYAATARAAPSDSASTSTSAATATTALLGPGVPLLHETHRGRILYAPWVSVPLLERFPSLLLTADLSHWVVVGERHLDAYPGLMKLIASRTRHIHARPCSPNQIQLRHCQHSPDDLNSFKAYWREIFAAQKASQSQRASQGQSADSKGLTPVCSVDPELGPPPYHPLSEEGESAGQAEVDAEIDVVVEVVKSVWRELA